jgi:hypothetical protein
MDENHTTAHSRFKRGTWHLEDEDSIGITLSVERQRKFTACGSGRRANAD